MKSLFRFGSSAVLMASLFAPSAFALVDVFSVNEDLYTPTGAQFAVNQEPPAMPNVRTARTKLSGVGTVTIGDEKYGYPRVGLQAGTEVDVTYYFADGETPFFWDGVFTAPAKVENPNIAAIKWTTPENHADSEVAIIETYAFTPPRGVIGFSPRANMAFKPKNVTDGTPLYFAFHQGNNLWTVRDDAKCIVSDGICAGTVGRVEKVALIKELSRVCPTESMENGTIGAAPECRVQCDLSFQLSEDGTQCNKIEDELKTTEEELKDELLKELLEEEAQNENTEEEKEDEMTEAEEKQEEVQETSEITEEKQEMGAKTKPLPLTEQIIAKNAEMPSMYTKESNISSLKERVFASAAKTMEKRKVATSAAENNNGFITDKNGKKRYVGVRKTLRDVLATEEGKTVAKGKFRPSTKGKTQKAFSASAKKETAKAPIYMRAVINSVLGSPQNAPSQKDAEFFKKNSYTPILQAVPHAGAAPLALMVVLGLGLLSFRGRKRK